MTKITRGPLSPQDLKAWRRVRGISQSELAKLLGRTGNRAERTVSNWEREVHPIPPDLHLTLTGLDVVLGRDGEDTS